MNEELKIDGNGRWVLGGITNDSNEYIRNARVNPITGALIVEANVVSTNTQIGSTIPGGTDGSVLFIGLGSTLAQDNANFFWDDTNNFLGLGTNTPSTTLHVVGDAIITGDAGTADELLGRDSGTGELSGVSIGSGLSLVAGVLSATGGGGGGYDQIQDNGVNVTQRTTLNFVNYFTVTDGGGVTNTSIDVAALGADATFISTLESNLDLANISGQIDLATQVTGLLPAANIDITNLESTLDLANIAGQISLTTQVSGTLGATNGGTGQNAVAQGDLLYGSAVNTWSRLAKNTSATRYLSNTGTSNNPAWAQVDLTNGITGVLPLANGGTGSNLSDPGGNRLWGWDDTDNSIGFWTIGSGLSYDHATHTLTATGTPTFAVNAAEDVTTWSTSPMIIDADLGWTLTSAPTAYVNGWVISTNTTAGASFTAFGEAGISGGGGTPTSIDFSAGTWRLRIKGTIINGSATAGTATNRYYWFGLSSSTNNQLNGDITDVTNRVGFSVYNGNIYFITADGTNVTATSLGARASDQWDMVVVDFDRTTARYWLNGVSGSTTTNVPINGTVRVTMGGYNGAGGAAGISVIAPVISTQYNP